MPESKSPPDPAAANTIVLKFDGTQAQKVDRASIQALADRFGTSIEDQAHLGLLMLQLVEERKLTRVNDDQFVITIAASDKIDLPTLREMADRCGLRLDEVAATATIAAVTTADSERLNQMPLDPEPDAEPAGKPITEASELLDGLDPIPGGDADLL